MSLIDQLIDDGYLKSSVIIEAFREVKREDFVLDEFKDEAEGNYPLPIGYEQTISQPLTVAFMLELLQPKKGDKILDVGTGSGWTTALLASIVGEEGKVYGIEYIPELKEFGENNIKKYNHIEKNIVQMFCKDGTKGLKEKAPFDKILVSAMADKVPQALKDQLKIKGRLLIPVEDGVSLFIKKSDNTFDETRYPGFTFVPLVN
ncbi:protein-L-isoaspartate O-methyltransferase [Candidatus Falkowbacteria bacterium]|jgi:protein-L-isoaspartate(D-aspartate) O-methyltransferase|nr:protein-L-isoaspartate O-methyltransferase [Candidatus Falkowbacteria bacterium]MBT4433392.1 protein-L-isoaspartate O-methyltransferase [Candidatus Falkowbacteria bacterium]